MRTFQIILLFLLIKPTLYGQRNCGSNDLLLEKDQQYPELRLLEQMQKKG